MFEEEKISEPTLKDKIDAVRKQHEIAKTKVKDKLSEVIHEAIKGFKEDTGGLFICGIEIEFINHYHHYHNRTNLDTSIVSSIKLKTNVEDYF